MQIRPAKHTDRKEILEICSEVWEGHDYVPRVLDRWLEDAKGQLWVVEMGGKVVAFGRHSLLGPGEAWLEGARVKKEYRGKGIASNLLDHFLDLARKEKVQSLRYATHISNVASLKMAQNRQAKEAGIFHLMEKEVDTTYQLPFEPERVEYSNEAYESLKKSLYIRKSKGFFSYQWKFRLLTPNTLKSFLQEGQLYQYGRGYLLLYPATPEHPYLYISAVSGTQKDIESLLLWTFNQGQKRKATSIFAKIPPEKSFIELFYRLNFQTWEKDGKPDIILFQFIPV